MKKIITFFLAASVAIGLFPQVANAYEATYANKGITGLSKDTEKAQYIDFGESYSIDTNYNTGYALFSVGDRGYIDINFKKISDYSGERYNDVQINIGTTGFEPFNPVIKLDSSFVKNANSEPTYSARVGVAPGTYYMEVKMTSSYTGWDAPKTAEISVSHTGNNGWETEPNDYQSGFGFEDDFILYMPTAIGLNATVNALVESPLDVFSVDVQAARPVRVYLNSFDEAGFQTLTFTSAPNSSSTGGRYFQKTVSKQNISFDEGRKEYYADFDITEPGKYYISLMVPGNNIKNQTYSIRVEYAKDQAEVIQEEETKDTPNTSGGETIYRLFNPTNGDHIFTISTDDRDFFTRSGWELETSPGKNSDTKGTPVYMLTSPAGEHMYTADKNEVKNLVNNYGWTKENNGEPAFYGAKSGKPMYRLFNPKAASAIDSHLFTLDENEIKVLVNKNGWEQDNGGKPVFYLAQ